MSKARSLPLCGMPMTMFSHSMSVILSIMAFIPGIKVSQPSRPNLLAAVYLQADHNGGIDLFHCDQYWLLCVIQPVSKQRYKTAYGCGTGCTCSKDDTALRFKCAVLDKLATKVEALDEAAQTI